MITGFSYAWRALQGAREGQEDSCQFARPGGGGTVRLSAHAPRQSPSLLAVLADGMGGHIGGAEASRAACQGFIAAYEAGEGATRGRLAKALDAANRAILEALSRDRSLAGMGCTLLGAHFGEDGLSWVSVGDSPLFLFRGDRLYQLNEDHSLAPVLDRLVALGELGAEEAEEHPRRHFLRAALTGRTIDLVDLSASAVALEQGDWILLASDGIETLNHGELADLLLRQREATPDELAAAVLAEVEAHAAANQDNTTVMAIRPVLAAAMAEP